jgi:hypothetical protein
MIEQHVSDTVLTHAWRYFELHANQRMSIFNFFLVLSGVISTGLAASIQGSAYLGCVGVFLGILLTLVSFVFWKLDQRVSFLIKHAENALSEIECALPDECTRLFLHERGKTAVAVSSGRWWSRHWTYGRCFRLVFLIMAFVGLGGSALSMLRFADLISW